MWRRRRVLRPVRPLPIRRRRIRWLPGCILTVVGAFLIVLIVALVLL